MTSKLKKPLKILTITIALFFAIWFLIFKWHIVPYPLNDEYSERICYSPNHEFYIKRYQTIFESGSDQLYAKGIAVLYNKKGKKLYKATTYLSGMFGPYWGDSSIFFEGDERDFYIKPPSSPGKHSELNKGCF